MKELTALGSNVIVAYDEPKEEVTDSGIIVANNPEFRKMPDTGEVISVGKDVTECKVGDRVVFSEKSPRGFRTERGGQPYLKLDESQITAIIKP